ncbi:MAG: hypothetical protein FJ038_11640, partial [Chloroflexi bacterium]|nr:hypothetical protein [Chloroflexota bacterium]
MSERVAVGDGLGAHSPRAPAQTAPVRLTAGSAFAAPAVIVGEALLVLAGTLPVWGSRLEAPQYPKGLSLWVYGNRTEGDVTEINGLNHYIGMRAIDVSTVPELAFWPWALVAAGLLLLVAVFQRGLLG